MARRQRSGGCGAIAAAIFVLYAVAVLWFVALRVGRMDVTTTRFFREQGSKFLAQRERATRLRHEGEALNATAAASNARALALLEHTVDHVSDDMAAVVAESAAAVHWDAQFHHIEHFGRQTA